MNYPFKVALLCLIGWSLTGCYYLQAAQGQISLMARRQPIASVLASPEVDARLRSRLEYVQAVRSFATQQLSLPDNQSYSDYVDIKRRFVSWNVFAAPMFSVEPQQWCFPVAGCVVYRGYFSEAAAERYARNLRMRGLDASVSAVPAYSTLGHFNDPVLSSMLNWNDGQLVATLFHELAHQVVYVKNDSAFNEAFATVVEEAGLDRWLTGLDRHDDWQLWQVQRQRAAEFHVLLLHTREDLRSLYASNLPKAQMAERKQQRLGQLKFEYQQLKEGWQGYSGYDGWFDRALSNADFVSIATYQRCVPAFERLLGSVDNDLSRFYTEVKKLAHQNSLTRQRFCN